jgi:hypothetical protein
MTGVLVLAEGETDIGVVKAILHKLGCSGNVRQMRGNRVEKLCGFIDGGKNDYGRFIVLKDLHRYDERTIDQRFRGIRNKLSTPERCRTSLAIVRRAIEAWLLADPESLNRAFGFKNKIIINNPEEITDPAEELDRILQRHGKRYIKGISMASKIAAELDVRNAMKRSASLKAFCEIVTTPFI